MGQEDSGGLMVLREDRTKYLNHKVNNTEILRSNFMTQTYEDAVSMIDSGGKIYDREPGTIGGAK